MVIYLAQLSNVAVMTQDGDAGAQRLAAWMQGTTGRYRALLGLGLGLRVRLEACHWQHQHNSRNTGGDEGCEVGVPPIVLHNGCQGHASICSTCATAEECMRVWLGEGAIGV